MKRAEEIAAIGISILGGILCLPIVLILYSIPSVKQSFEQIAYEDAMLG